jgi:transposase
MTTTTSAVTVGLEGRAVVAGVDTHAGTHHVGVCSLTGTRLGDIEIPANPAGYRALVDFVATFGVVQMIGVEGTSSYGAGLARFLTTEAIEFREVIRPRRTQRRQGKSDPLDAYAAAEQVLADPDGLPIAKSGDGIVEQIRVLLTVRRSAIKARVAAIRQIKSLLITAPEPLKQRWAHLPDRELLASLAATRPRAATDSVAAATARTLRRLARRHHYLGMEIAELDDDLRALVNTAAPAMIATKGYGVITTATLLVTAGANPHRLRSEASFAALCGTSPIPASSGKTRRYRLNRGGDRQANWALHQIALVRLSNDPRTRDYADRLRATGKSKKDVLRCLKRAIAREAFHLIAHPQPVPDTTDLRALRHQRGATLVHAAMSIGAEPARLSELERGKRPDALLTARYRRWLTAG